MSQEQYPVDPAIKVLKAKDIYKTEKWWKAVLLVDSFGTRVVSVYQWIKDKNTGKWKRKQKMTVKSKDEWSKIVNALAEMMEAI